MWYNKKTLIKIISQFKPAHIVVWVTVVEQYRVACGKLGVLQPAVIKNFFQENVQEFHEEADWKSGDDMTSKCQALSRSLGRR